MKRTKQLMAASLLAAALVPLQSRASSNLWNNASANATWDTTSANWTSPTIWAQGDDAFFGATGAGTVTLGTSILCPDMTFTASYTLVASGYYFTNESASGQSVITSAVGTSNQLQLSIYGSNNVTFTGTGTTVLQGDPSVNDANHYTGETYIRSGTVVLSAVSGGEVNGNSSTAIGSISALDAGALLQMAFPSPTPGGPVVDLQAGQLPYNRPGAKLLMTGGTFDLNGWRRNGPGGPMPCPDGSGLIVNSSPWLQSSIVVYGDGTNHTFSGQINDGGPQGPGLSPAPFSDKAYQIGIVDLHYGTGGYEWTLSGSNTYSGSTRLGNASIKLAGAGTLGIPSTIPGWTGPLRIYSGNHLDLNGTSQTVGGMGSSGNGGNCYNTAVGTVSTLRGGGYGSDSFNCGWNIIDNPGTGGVVALTCYGTGTQQYSANAPGNSYSGDTVVLNGTNVFSVTTAVSPNSAFRLHTPTATGGVLSLTYAGSANVKQLFVNGAQLPNGTYGAAQFPNIITGTGTLTVTGSTGADSVWDNGSGNFLWDTTSVNWSGSTWSQGNGAIFNTAGGGPVNLLLNEGYDIPNLVLNSNYSIVGNGAYTTNAVITASAGTSNSLGLSMWGTNGLVFNGAGTTILLGDLTVNDAGHYTGGTYIHSGTVICQATPAGSTAGSAYAIDGVAALDAGATLMLPGIWNGSAYVGDSDQFAINGQVAAFPRSFLHMTGGTLDLNNDPGTQHIPAPDGTGTIINNGSWSQSRALIYTDGQDHSWYGVIADGNNGALNGDNTGADNGGQGPGYQVGAIWVVGGISVNGVPGGAAGPYQYWYWYGSNTCSASFRLDNGVYFKLMGPVANISNPTTNGLTGPMRLYNGVLDLNGHNQTVALMTHGGTGIIQNTAPGTISTLTFGYGNEQVFTRYAQYTFQDSWGGGGILALKKINTAPYAFPVVGPTQYIATNCVQDLRGICTYSGDTTLLGGGLILSAATAVSPNSAYRLYTPNSYTLLTLNYSGTAPCRQLWINGVQQPNGVYGAGTPGIDPASTGTLTVTGYAPVVLNSSYTPPAGANPGSLNFSWSGVYKLQSKTNLVGGVWTDIPGVSPLSIPVNPATREVFFRLATY